MDSGGEQAGIVPRGSDTIEEVSMDVVLLPHCSILLIPLLKVSPVPLNDERSLAERRPRRVIRMLARFSDHLPQEVLLRLEGERKCRLSKYRLTFLISLSCGEYSRKPIADAIRFRYCNTCYIP
jgi:hypothetical protein